MQKYVGSLISDRVDQFNFLKSKADSKIKPPDAPKLTSIAGWEPFHDAFDLYMSHYRTVIRGVPLNFLLCDHSVATAEQLLASYTNIDTVLTVTAAHKGEVYRKANKLLYQLLKPLIGDSMFHLIAKYQSTMDGRSVFNAIKNQAEGKHAVIAKAHSAYKAIADVKFTGKHNSTNFATYLKIFHAACSHLQEFGWQMSEVQKIKVLCNGINGRALDMAKGDITFHPNLYPTYMLVQEVLNTAWIAAKTSSAMAPPDSRTVAAAGIGNYENKDKIK
jgi:hypothetical protein